jgi:hypothetical protein
VFERFKKLNIATLLAYFGLALIVTWPLILHFKTAFICSPTITDERGHWLYSVYLFENRWLHWSLWQILSFPYEVVDHFNFLDVPFDIMLKKLLGFPAFLNAFQLLALTLSGWAAYKALLYFTENRSLAFTLGCFYAFSSLVLNFLPVSSMMRHLLFWLPLGVLYSFKLLNTKSALNAIWAGLFAGLTAISYWYFGMFVFLWLVLFFIYFYVFIRVPKAKKDFILKSLIVLLTFAIVALPFFSPMLLAGKQAFTNPHFRTFALSWLKPFPSLEAILKGEGGFTPELIFNHSSSLEHLLDFPYILLFLALFPLLWYLKKEQGFWLLNLVLFYLISLGPYLKWNNTPITLGTHAFPSPLYFFLYSLVPGFTRINFLERADLFVGLALIMLAALNLKTFFIETQMPKRTQKLILLVCLALFFAFQLQKGNLPLPLFKMENIPPFYYQLAKLPTCKVLELPFSDVELEPLRKIYYLVHQHENLDSVNDYLNGELPKALQKSELFKWLERLNDIPYRGENLDFGKVKKILKINQIQYLVLDYNFYSRIYPKDNLGSRLYIQNYHILKQSFGTPVYQSPEFSAFKMY